MSIRLKGRYKPEEILRIENNKQSYEFPTNKIRPEIKAIIFPESCTFLENNDIHHIFPNLTEVIWPNIEKMNSFLFSFCENLKYFQTMSCTRFPESAFMESGLISIIFPRNLTTLGIGCFKGCKSLKSVDLSNLTISRIDISDYCFSYCSSLSKFDFDKCKSIGYYAFNNSGITKAVLNSPSNYSYKVSECAFSLSKLEYLEINGKAELEKQCFANCFNLKNVKLNFQITSLPEKAFYGDKSLENISGIEKLQTIGAYCFFCCPLKNFNNFANVNKIDEFAFAENKFNEVVSNASKIEDNAFYNCFELKSVTLTSSELKKISNNVFEKSVLEYVDLSNTGITIINEHMFDYAPLTEVLLPSKLTIIKAYAFTGTAISKIKIPFSVTEIGQNAFKLCNNLKEVVWSPNCKKVKEGTFYGCSNLTKIIGSEYIESIDNYAFADTIINLNLPQLKELSYFSFLYYKGSADLRATSACICDRKAVPSNVLLPYFYD